MKKGIKWPVLILSFIAVYSVAFFGSILTSQSAGSQWYDSIKPAITPPNWVFPVVWNFLFLLIAFSLYLLLIHAKNRTIKREVKIVFGINFFLNLLWSFLFFTLQKPSLAFIEIFFFFASILLVMKTSLKINRKAFFLLVPYALWTIFAGILNYLIVF